MQFEYSAHHLRKKKYRADIAEYMIEYAIMHSDELRDRYWRDASNAVCRIPPSGRILKVVYRKIGSNKYKIITTYWLD